MRTRNAAKLVWVLLFFGAPVTLSACGISYFGEQYRIGLLNPYIVGSDYTPFFYRSERPYAYEPVKDGKDRRQNCAAWTQEIGSGINHLEVCELIYNYTLDDMLIGLEDQSQSRPIQYNSAWMALQASDKKPILDYLIWAKRYEDFSAQKSNQPWAKYDYSYSEYLRDETSILNELYQKAEQAYQNTSSTFLKERYAYQLLVMARYRGDFDTVENLYETYFKNQAQHALAGWARHHYITTLDKEAEQTYLYALTFVECPEKAIYAYQNFNKNLAQEAKAFATTAYEKASIDALLAIRNPGPSLALIQSIGNQYPEHPLLPVLLMREVNKLEDWVLTFEMTGLTAGRFSSPSSARYQNWKAYQKRNYQNDRLKVSELQQYLKRLTQLAPKSADLWHLMDGHLANLKGDSKEAQVALQKMSAAGKYQYRDQLHRERFLILTRDADLENTAVQNEIVDLLQIIQQTPVKGNLRAQVESSTYYRILAQAYMDRGLEDLAFFFHNYSLPLPGLGSYDYSSNYFQHIQFLDKLNNPQIVQKVIARMLAPAQSSFDRLLLAAPLPTLNMLYDLEGTLAFRKNDLAIAKAAFQKVDPTFWKDKYAFSNHLIGSPFYLQTGFSSKDSFPDTKTEIIDQLIALEADRSPLALYELAVAWYNFSYYGKSWMMMCYGRSGYELGQYASTNDQSNAFRLRDPQDRAIYYQANRSLQYLERLRKQKPDAELQAKVQFLSLLIQQNGKDLEWNEQQPRLKVAERLKLRNEIFDDWLANAKETKYYQEVLMSCSNLRTYVSD